jgi:small basic protein
MKWVLYGVGISVVGMIVLSVGYASVPGGTKPGSLYDLSSYWLYPPVNTAIPISIAIAMLRSQLWDVDRVINRTLVYGSLTVTLAALYIGGVIGLQALFQAMTGQSSDLAIAIATLAVAALFNPWRHRLQRFIDRRFYRHKYDASRILAAFNATLRDDVDLDHLSADIAAVVHETVNPAHLSLWLRSEATQ